MKASFDFITDRLAIGDKNSRAVSGFSAVVSILATERPGTLACEQTAAPQVPNGLIWHSDWYRSHRNVLDNCTVGVPVLMVDLADGEGHYLGKPRDRFGNAVPSRGLEDYLDDITDFIARCIRSGHVLVHCGAGISRSPAVVVAYLCRYCGMGLSEAVAFVSERRHGAAPAECFKRAIDGWLSLTELTTRGPRPQ